MKILVAGGAGYIGSMLVPALIEQGHEVKVIDLLWFGNHLPKKVHLEKRDLFSCTIDDFKGFDQVIFLAGLSNDPMAEYNPRMNFIDNGALPGYMSLLAKQAGVKRFIYASSCSIYGYAQDKLYAEEDPTTCGYPYGVSKLQGEFGCVQLNDENFSVIALRQGTVSGYSPRMRLDLIINTMFKFAMKEGKITVNNPSIWRPILDIRDAVNAYMRAVQADQSISGVFNVASENYTVGFVAERVKAELERLMKNKIKLEVKNIQDFRNYKVSTEKAKTILGFHPQYAIRDTIQNIFENRKKFLEQKDDTFCYNIKVFKKLKQK